MPWCKVMKLKYKYELPSWIYENFTAAEANFWRRQDGYIWHKVKDVNCGQTVYQFGCFLQYMAVFDFIMKVMVNNMKNIIRHFYIKDYCDSENIRKSV